MKPCLSNGARHHLIQLYPLPPDQALHAVLFLNSLEGVIAHDSDHKHCISVLYHLPQYRLLWLENQLKQAGFHLDESILSKIKRALVHYCEDIACSNLEIPEHNVKSRDVYVKVWEKHPHGDHDETPEELRRYL
ncbi:hypothetical protein [Iodobacter fluviatilis]|uniref:Uncharacterized protein n=1 Tax=Iodobacter fluviatilis TaxID=537 RepID=A0A377Q3G3_9NEIS|nr:hypothetical protein [Iodobacter fluviatilis]TCU90082.1 hypothetical protein EV682_101101 [Iodobacter fluviatilis]STQ89109.1 Uncharacterised protein [Iodobacter fluviatilis]